MKNPVTFSISEARKVQKKRQFRQIVLLCAIILLLAGTLLVVRVLTMKKEADQLFPSVSENTETSVLSESETTAASGVIESSLPSETTAPEVTSTPAAASLPSDSSGTSKSNASGTGVSTGTSVTVSPASTAAPTLPPEVDVHMPDMTALQTTTHKARDSAYHELQKNIQALISQQKDTRCGIYYINLKNGEEFGYNDMIPFVVGSAISLPINIMLYDQAKTGGLSLSEIMTYSSADTMAGTGTIQTTAVGSQHYIRELSGLSITAGDNTATAMLLRRLGGIDLFCANTKQISDVVDYRTNVTYTDYAGVQQTGKNRTSAQDLAKYMKYLYTSYLANPSVFQPLFNDLAHSSSKWGVASGLPSDILVCHKTGSDSIFKSETDVSMICAEEPYILCVSVECADQAAARNLQQKLGNMVYAYLHGCYS
jgi:beta-lactamase class A